MKLSKFASSIGLSAVLVSAPAAFSATAAPSHLAPAVERFGHNLGRESAEAEVSAVVWLNLHNKAQFDARVQALYTPGSPTFHQWLTLDQLKQYAPTAAELAAVTSELESQNLQVSAVDNLNFAIRVSGQSADLERAFQTQINRTELKGETIHTTTSAPRLTDAAGALVATITGFNTGTMRAAHMPRTDPATGQPAAGIPISPDASSSPYSNTQCILPPQTANLSVTGTTAGVGTFTGLTYGVNAAGTGPGPDGCAYGPAELQQIYSLGPTYKAGYNGKGETVVIVDAYGSPTIQADTAAYNSIFKLPAFNSGNFAVYKSAPFTGSDAGWALETTLDVESAHAIAPGAKIAVVAAPSNQDSDLQSAILFAVTNKLGDVISNSYSGSESFDTADGMNTWNEICQVAASLGISVNFATGDNGDLYLQEGYTDVPTPANSPYATGVGGTSVVLGPDGSANTTGWGNNITYLSYRAGNLLVFPAPYNLPNSSSSFYGGSGGGISGFFNKPYYQADLAGAGRHTPDVSALADPFTGFPIVFTSAGLQQIEVFGGTSLATPLFSGMWAIIDQIAGGPIGQAAPYMSAAAQNKLLTDVVPLAGPANVTGVINLTASPDYPTGLYTFTSQELAEPFYPRDAYTSTLWEVRPNEYLDLTFGTDSSLEITPGWDAATGYGTPNFTNVLGALKH